MDYTYEINVNSGILRRNDGTIIPNDDTTELYQEYVAWLEEGNSVTINIEPDAVEIDHQLTLDW